MTDTYPRAKFDGDVIESVDISSSAEALIKVAIAKLSGGMYQSSYECSIINDLEQALVLFRFNELGLTEAQKQAVLRVYHRGPVTKDGHGNRYEKPLTLLRFVDTLQPTYHMDGCIVIPWQGMFLAVESDGYVHS
jgi:hypothetical protein